MNIQPEAAVYQSSFSSCHASRISVALTFYEDVSLLTIGRDSAPYRIAAPASLTGCSIGHNPDATVFTSHAVHRCFNAACHLPISAGCFFVLQLILAVSVTGGGGYVECGENNHDLAGSHANSLPTGKTGNFWLFEHLKVIASLKSHYLNGLR